MKLNKKLKKQLFNIIKKHDSSIIKITNVSLYELNEYKCIVLYEYYRNNLYYYFNKDTLLPSYRTSGTENNYRYGIGRKKITKIEWKSIERSDKIIKVFSKESLV